MCTISIVPCGKNIIFTFNRDEHPNRKTPEYLSQKKLAHKNIYYAKDVKASGSWFAVDDKGNIAMLFNGAFVKHIKAEKYTKSRGIVLLEIFSSINCLRHFNQYDFTNIEPFSIILYERKDLYRLVWDGNKSEVINLDKSENHIFSSCTIYTKEIQNARKNWLQFFIENNKTTEENIFNFHTTYKKRDDENGLIMKRDDTLQTLSVSQAVINNNQVKVQHMDMVENKKYFNHIELV